MNVKKDIKTNEKGTLLKKFLKKLTVIFSVIAINMFTFAGASGAVTLKSADIKNGGDCGNLLIYKGVVVKTYYAYYESNGKQYPAYCLDKTKHGVSDSLAYSVSVEDSIHDVGLWRYIINGYPYKSYSELGCANKEEAFSATKQAIYCYIHGNDVNSYAPIGEAGKRTVAAIKKIVSAARNSNENQCSSSIVIKRLADNFVQDNINKNYVSKTYEITANAGFSKYNVNLLKNNKDLVEGIKVTDLNNKVKNQFAANEKFKVLVPIDQMKSAGEFKISVNTSINTKPVLYGKAANSAYQDYALTAATYEDASEVINDTYFENKANLKIIKKDKETNERMEGVEFEVLNSDKKVIYANLKTDKNGEIVLTHILPGTYYIRETKTKDGYIKNPQLLKIEAKLNESITVTFNNVKESKATITVDEKEVEVSYYEEDVKENENKEKTTISIENKNNEKTSTSNENIYTEKNSKEVEQKNTNTNVQNIQKSTVIKRLPVTGM